MTTYGNISATTVRIQLDRGPVRPPYLVLPVLAHAWSTVCPDPTPLS